MEAWREELYHHGIKGQKWGVRRWQNEDGTFNEAGKKRYFSGNGEIRSAKKEYRKAVREYRKTNSLKNQFGMNMVKNRENLQKATDKLNASYDKLVDAKIAKASAKGARAEKRAYQREAYRVGLPGSAKDTMTGGAASRLYDRMTAKKGQDYADGVLKHTRNTAIAVIAGSVALTVGQAYLRSKYGY